MQRYYAKRMKTDEHIASCACRQCNRPMKLINSVPRLGGLPELLVFYCGDCDEVNGRSEPADVPTMWR
jgi:hypothetical protein